MCAEYRRDRSARSAGRRYGSSLIKIAHDHRQDHASRSPSPLRGGGRGGGEQGVRGYQFCRVVVLASPYCGGEGWACPNFVFVAPHPYPLPARGRETCWRNHAIRLASRPLPHLRSALTISHLLSSRLPLRSFPTFHLPHPTTALPRPKSRGPRIPPLKWSGAIGPGSSPGK